MALTPCPRCNMPISEKATVCPQCEVNIQEYLEIFRQEEQNKHSETVFLECPECGNLVKDYDSPCPKCGFPLNDNNAMKDLEQYRIEYRKTIRKLSTGLTTYEWVIMVSAVVVCIGISIVSYFVDPNSHLALLPIVGIAVAVYATLSNESKRKQELAAATENFDEYYKEKKRREEEIRSYQESAAKERAMYMPKCPTCGAPNIKMIGDLERGLSVGALGFASRKIGKTFKCKTCGYTW